MQADLKKAQTKIKKKKKKLIVMNNEVAPVSRKPTKTYTNIQQQGNSNKEPTGTRAAMLKEER